MDSDISRRGPLPFLIYFVAGNVLTGIIIVSLGIVRLAWRGLSELVLGATGVVTLPIAAGALIYMVVRWAAPTRNGELPAVIVSGIIILLSVVGSVAAAQYS